MAMFFTKHNIVNLPFKPPLTLNLGGKDEHSDHSHATADVESVWETGWHGKWIWGYEEKVEVQKCRQAQWIMTLLLLFNVRIIIIKNKQANQRNEKLGGRSYTGTETAILGGLGMKWKTNDNKIVYRSGKFHLIWTKRFLVPQQNKSNYLQLKNAFWNQNLKKQSFMTN